MSSMRRRRAGRGGAAALARARARAVGAPVPRMGRAVGGRHAADAVRQRVDGAHHRRAGDAAGRVRPSGGGGRLCRAAACPARRRGRPPGRCLRADAEAIASREARITELAYRDALTGLPNRGALHLHARALPARRRGRGPDAGGAHASTSTASSSSTTPSVTPSATWCCRRSASACCAPAFASATSASDAGGRERRGAPRRRRVRGTGAGRRRLGGAGGGRPHRHGARAADEPAGAAGRYARQHRHRAPSGARQRGRRPDALRRRRHVQGQAQPHRRQPLRPRRTTAATPRACRCSPSCVRPSRATSWCCTSSPSTPSAPRTA